MEKNTLILIVAGEASGDLHAAHLVEAIKKIRPDTAFLGLGGERLKAQGVEICYDIVSLAVVGLFEVLKNLKKFKGIFDGLLREVDSRKPDLAILVDYPGFNLRLAGELKKRGIPVIYYISPQVWAWGQGRIATIKRLVDLMLVVFAFEEKLYKEHGVRAAFVGHPLLDIVKPSLRKEETLQKAGLNAQKFTFALLPGSREKEVRVLLPIMLDTARLLFREKPDSQFLILRSPNVAEDLFRRICASYQLPVGIVSDMTYDGLKASDFALVASGTATLETALMGVPMVILYKISFFTWAYLRNAIKIPYIGLVNVIRNKKVVAEFIQYGAKPGKIADYILSVVSDAGAGERIKKDLRDTVGLLGEKGASERAARQVVDFLGGKDETGAY
jgi:lipid-A-disaccharide synthase